MLHAMRLWCLSRVRVDLAVGRFRKESLREWIDWPRSPGPDPVPCHALPTLAKGEHRTVWFSLTWQLCSVTLNNRKVFCISHFKSVWQSKLKEHLSDLSARCQRLLGSSIPALGVWQLRPRCHLASLMVVLWGARLRTAHCDLNAAGLLGGCGPHQGTGALCDYLTRQIKLFVWQSSVFFEAETGTRFEVKSHVLQSKRHVIGGTPDQTAWGDAQHCVGQWVRQFGTSVAAIESERYFGYFFGNLGCSKNSRYEQMHMISSDQFLWNTQFSFMLSGTDFFLNQYSAVSETDCLFFWRYHFQRYCNYTAHIHELSLDCLHRTEALPKSCMNFEFSLQLLWQDMQVMRSGNAATI
jgi:hypothetical protein